MGVTALEQKLFNAQKRRDEASEASRLHFGAAEWADYNADHNTANAALLEAERELAEAKGEEYAVPSGFPILWDGGAPLPLLVADGHNTFLIFYVRSYDPKWDGTYITIQGPANGNADPMALVEFKGCRSVKFGAPNNEVHEGHPLAGKGLDSSTAQIVRNSKWLAELENINKVHSQYNPNRWRNLKHFVFWFHDDTFECIADDYQVEVYNETLASILSRVYQRIG